MNGDQRRGRVAKNVLALRKMRQAFFQRDLFDEHAWTMLLVLFIGLAANEVIDVPVLLERANASSNAGRRWLQHLAADGYVVTREGEDDVVLTPLAIAKLRAFLDDVSKLNWNLPPGAVEAPEVPDPQNR